MRCIYIQIIAAIHAESCSPPVWKKGMGKSFHGEPTGNAVNIKCMIKEAEKPNYPSDINPVQWFWLQSKDADDLEQSLPVVSDYTDKSQFDSWEEFTKKLGIQLYPTTEIGGIHNKTSVKAKGQRLSIKEVAPSKTNGFFTCIFVKPCGSFIGHSMYVSAVSRRIARPQIIHPGSSCCLHTNNNVIDQCYRSTKLHSDLVISCRVSSGSNTNIKWAIFNDTSNSWQEFKSTELVLIAPTDASNINCGTDEQKSVDYSEKLLFSRIDKSKNGTKYKCVATNTQGSTAYVWILIIHPEVLSAEVWLGVTLSIALFVGIITLVMVKFNSYQKKTRGLKTYEIPDVPMKTYVYIGDNRDDGAFLCPQESEISKILHDFPPSVQLDRSSINLFEMIGTGQFGIVYRAEIDDGSGRIKQVAIKTLKNEMNLEDNNKNTKDLINEFKTMWSYGRHENLIVLEGICATHKPYWLVMEFCAKGNLRDFLRGHRPSEGDQLRIHCLEGTESDQDRKLSLVDLISMVRQISVGMRYLEEKSCIHRDLAARNILVTENVSMKISDFGLARNVEDTDYYTMMTQTKSNQKGLMPWRWMAIETLEQKVFTTASDVWSFGIVVWEIFTFGMMPYMTLENDEILKFLQKAKRLEQPIHATDEIYKIMLNCWSLRPDERPNFRTVSEDSEKMLYDLGIGDIYLDLEKED